MGLENRHDLLGQFAIFPLPGALRAFSPGVEAPCRHPQHAAHNPHFKVLAVVLDKEKTFFYGREKMASAFFNISRSWRKISFSRCKRRSSSSSGCWFPLPTNARSPFVAISVHQRLNVLMATPRSSATCLCDFPLVCTRRTASCLKC